MTMRPEATTPRTRTRRSIFRLGGGDTYSEEEVAAPSPPGTEGKRDGEVEGRALQEVQTKDPSRQDVAGQGS